MTPIRNNQMIRHTCRPSGALGVWGFDIAIDMSPLWGFKTWISIGTVVWVETAQLETTPTKYGSENVYLFLKEFTITWIWQFKLSHAI